MIVCRVCGNTMEGKDEAIFDEGLMQYVCQDCNIDRILETFNEVEYSSNALKNYVDQIEEE